VLQTPRALYRGLTALSAAMVTFHPQLVLALSRNRQIRKLIYNSFSHIFPFNPIKEYLSRFDRASAFYTQTFIL
jgi:hypothetical protein